MGIETALAATAIASIAGSAYSAKQQKKQLKEQKRQYEETKAEAEKIKQGEINKQKELSSIYKNMKTNLYSGDINGIDSDVLVQ